MLQQDSDVVLQWARNVMNTGDNHHYGTTYDDYKHTQVSHTTSFVTTTKPEQTDTGVQCLLFLTLRFLL